MMTVNELKNRLVEAVIEREGGYVFDASDRGGETMYGITEQVARANGYKGDMRHLPYELAFHIYAAKYWDPLRLDEVASHCIQLAEQLFDFGVNSGIANSGKALQQALNVMNDRGRLYPDIVADGIVGSRTVMALQAFAGHRGEEGLMVLAECIGGQRIAFCMQIAIKDETQERFSYGWLKRVVELGRPAPSMEAH